MRVHLHNREGSMLLKGKRSIVLVLPDGPRVATQIQCRSGAGKRVLARIEGLSSRDMAADLKNAILAVAKADLPKPGPGEFYVADLQGLRVMVDGEDRGRVVDVHHTGGGDLLEVKVQGELYFVAFSGPHVLDVCVGEGHVTLDAAAVEEA